MLFPQFAAETQETIRGQAGLSALACLCSACPCSSPGGLFCNQWAALRVPCRDLGPEAGRDSLRKQDTGQGCSPWKTQVLEIATVDSLLSHQHWDSCRLGVGR